MRNRIMILCTFCAIAIFSFAQEKFSIRGIANEELNNQLLYLCLMGDGEKAKEVVLDLSVEQLIGSLNVISSLSSLQLTFQLLSQNFFYGILLAIPTGLVVMKKKN